MKPRSAGDFHVRPVMSALARNLVAMLLAGAGIITGRIALEVSIDPTAPQAAAGYGLPFWLWVAVAFTCFAAAAALFRQGKVDE
jgi:hypothetical protein